MTPIASRTSRSSVAVDAWIAGVLDAVAKGKTVIAGRISLGTRSLLAIVTYDHISGMHISPVEVGHGKTGCTEKRS